MNSFENVCKGPSIFVNIYLVELRVLQGRGGSKAVFYFFGVDGFSLKVKCNSILLQTCLIFHYQFKTKLIQGSIFVSTYNI